MAGWSVGLSQTTWRTWQDPLHGRNRLVRWTSILPDTASPVVGAVEIDPGGVLPRHHHEPAEIYHVLDGTGELEIEREVHRLRKGSTTYVPGDAWHETRNTGTDCLRIVFFFPEARMADVIYRFE